MGCGRGEMVVNNFNELDQVRRSFAEMTFNVGADINITMHNIYQCSITISKNHYNPSQEYAYMYCL